MRVGRILHSLLGRYGRLSGLLWRVVLILPRHTRRVGVRRYAIVGVRLHRRRLELLACSTCARRMWMRRSRMSRLRARLEWLPLREGRDAGVWRTIVGGVNRLLISSGGRGGKRLGGGRRSLLIE